LLKYCFDLPRFESKKQFFFTSFSLKEILVIYATISLGISSGTSFEEVFGKFNAFCFGSAIV